MPHEFDVRIKIEDTLEEIVLTGQLTDSEHKALEDFVTCSSDVSSSKFVLNEERGSLNIKWEAEKGMEVTTKLPDWDLVMVFLHKFRPILLNDERTNFGKVKNIVKQHLRHPYIHQIIDREADRYQGKKYQKQMMVQSIVGNTETLINSEKVLWDWLNSHEYHRNEAKREFVESLHHLLPLDASKVIFLGMLLDKEVAAFNLSKIIRVMLGKQNSVIGQVKRMDT